MENPKAIRSSYNWYSFMRLLFITQKIDKNDDVLGVYHQWVEELAKRIDKINVICLYRGRVELPANVSVYSLGKESGESKIKYLINFYRYIWRLRNDYDSIFVHMNPEYVILGGWFWKLLKKKITFWYNHPFGNWKARMAILFVDRILHTSPFAFSAKYKKAKIMPVGIDVNLFRRIPQIKKPPHSILYLGRLSPIKHLETLIEAVSLLDQRGVDFKLTIAGSPSKKSEIVYADSLKRLSQPLTEKSKVIFIGSVSNYKTPALYNAHELFVNMTRTGSFDKAIIESMACENLILVSNKTLQRVLPPECFFQEKNSRDLADKLKILMAFSEAKKTELGKFFRQHIANYHSMSKLIDRLASVIND